MRLAPSPDAQCAAETDVLPCTARSSILQSPPAPPHPAGDAKVRPIPPPVRALQLFKPQQPHQSASQALHAPAAAAPCVATCRQRAPPVCVSVHHREPLAPRIDQEALEPRHTRPGQRLSHASGCPPRTPPHAAQSTHALPAAAARFASSASTVVVSGKAVQRHVHQRCISAGRRRARPRPEALPLVRPGSLMMHMRVHQPRQQSPPPPHSPAPLPPEPPPGRTPHRIRSASTSTAPIPASLRRKDSGPKQMHVPWAQPSDLPITPRISNAHAFARSSQPQVHAAGHRPRHRQRHQAAAVPSAPSSSATARCHRHRRQPGHRHQRPHRPRRGHRHPQRLRMALNTFQLDRLRDLHQLRALPHVPRRASTGRACDAIYLRQRRGTTPPAPALTTHSIYEEVKKAAHDQPAPSPSSPCSRPKPGPALKHGSAATAKLPTEPLPKPPTTKCNPTRVPNRSASPSSASAPSAAPSLKPSRRAKLSRTIELTHIFNRSVARKRLSEPPPSCPQTPAGPKTVERCPLLRRRHPRRNHGRPRPRSSLGSRTRPPTRQIRRHRQQAAHRLSRRSPCRDRPRRTTRTSATDAAVAGGVPVIPGLPPGPRRRPHHAPLRHRQRHLQLHPVAHGSRRRLQPKSLAHRARPPATPRPTRLPISTASTPAPSSASSPASHSTPNSTPSTIATQTISHRLRHRLRSTPGSSAAPSARSPAPNWDPGPANTSSMPASAPCSSRSPHPSPGRTAPRTWSSPPASSAETSSSPATEPAATHRRRRRLGPPRRRPELPLRHPPYHPRRGHRRVLRPALPPLHRRRQARHRLRHLRRARPRRRQHRLPPPTPRPPQAPPPLRRHHRALPHLHHHRRRLASIAAMDCMLEPPLDLQMLTIEDKAED